MASAARNELIPVFVEEPETSVSSDFPETDADDLFQMPDKSSWDPSVSGKREEQHKDEKDGQSSCVPDVVITEADEGKLCHCSQVTKSHISSKRLALDVDNDGENAVYDLRQDKSSDMQSLKSEPGSLASEILASASLKSDIDQDVIDDELRSMATSSVTSFFQRLQLDPLERAWLQFAAIGNPAALTRLVLQDPTLTSKKDFTSGFTALHWAAKHGNLEVAELVTKAGVDTNVRSHGGYTPLHIAALHGQEQIIKLLINTYNANPDIRDYHGKKPMHYWKGNSNIFQPHPKEIIPQAPEGRKQNKRSYLPSLIETLAPTVKVDLKWSSCQDQNQPRQ